MTYLDELRASIPPSVVAILSDPALPSWERELRATLARREDALADLDAVPETDRDAHWRWKRQTVSDACRWQRDLIAEIKRFDEGT